MGNVLIRVDDTYSLSVYQNEDDGRFEVIPVVTDSKEWSGIGDPVFFEAFEELIELYDSARNHDWKVWTNQYHFEFEVYSNDNEDG